MGAAVREAAESLAETTEAKVEQRRQNAEDAKAYRAAQSEGRVLESLSVYAIYTDDLPRDRLDLEAVANSEEMDELKSSIRSRGQREPIEVFVDEAGRYQLQKGWRRVTALRQLHEETGEDQFGKVTARVAKPAEDQSDQRMARYIDMVEENVVREDLTFAEMAQVAIRAASDPAVEDSDPEALVGRLYGSLHKMKRSYIRSFVFLLTALGGSLQWPKDISRNQGVEIVRALKAAPERAGALGRELAACATRDDQAVVLEMFLKSPRRKEGGQARAPKEKYEFHVGDTKVTARKGECRILSGRDFADIPKDRLARAIRAFEEALKEEGNPRITSL
ncbi:MAG: ParB N-terminal domain-containing protein [Mangrovicoccus sp.]